VVSGIRDNCIFELKKSFWGIHPLLWRGLGRLLVELRKRLSPIEKGVSSYRREAFLASKKRPLCIKSAFS